MYQISFNRVYVEFCKKKLAGKAVEIQQNGHFICNIKKIFCLRYSCTVTLYEVKKRPVFSLRLAWRWWRAGRWTGPWQRPWPSALSSRRESTSGKWILVLTVLMLSRSCVIFVKLHIFR